MTQKIDWGDGQDGGCAVGCDGVKYEYLISGNGVVDKSDGEVVETRLSRKRDRVGHSSCRAAEKRVVSVGETRRGSWDKNLRKGVSDLVGDGDSSTNGVGASGLNWEWRGAGQLGAWCDDGGHRNCCLKG